MIVLAIAFGTIGILLVDKTSQKSLARHREATKKFIIETFGEQHARED